MKSIMSSFLFVMFSLFLNAQFTQADSVFVKKFYEMALSDNAAHNDLKILCKEIGNRIAGSENADKAIVWGEETLSGIADTVQKMPVMVPKWVREKNEYGAIVIGRKKLVIPVKALGGSVGTNGLLKAEVIECRDFEDLKKKGNEVKGKIVFFNKAFDPVFINTGSAYGNTFPIRSDGASEAAKYGAVGCIIRSLTSADDRFPHTGAMSYKSDVPQIPAAAISSVDAHTLHTKLEMSKVFFEMKMNCELFPDVEQFNVIGEIKGTQFPERIIVVGGHLDSWDVGEGAHDDGAGIVQSIEVLRLLKRAGYKPACTIRCVLYINEEFGNDGGLTYADSVHAQQLNHIAAIESDAGGFTPKGFSLDGTDEQVEWLKGLQNFFDPYNLYVFKRGGSGVDISPLKNGKTMLFGLQVDGQRYFDYHHTDNDIFENVNRRELELGAAAMTSLVYFLDQREIKRGE
ncbi:MAG: M28 family peptidase [Bacteroidetes bacterium]|nr:M28 family peptidase [Bacteroidota bacterium]